MEKKEKTIFPKGFFTQPRPHAKKQKTIDNIPFKWSENVLNGKSDVKIISTKSKTC